MADEEDSSASHGAEPGKAIYANHCLLARRVVEHGVRFVQLYHADWDHPADLGQPLTEVKREIDQPSAALLEDLKQRGLLDSTLVIWSGEFGWRDLRKRQGWTQSPHQCLHALDGRRRDQARHHCRRNR